MHHHSERRHPAPLGIERANAFFKTHFVVAGEDAGSKREMARQLGVRSIDVGELRSMLAQAGEPGEP